MVNHGCIDTPICEGTTEREHCKFNNFVLCLITLLSNITLPLIK